MFQSRRRYCTLAPPSPRSLSQASIAALAAAKSRPLNWPELMQTPFL
jgi:hypothetical protein